MILLDTHVLFWIASEPYRVSAPARQAVIEARNGRGIAIATVTLLELARLAQTGRIAVTGSVGSFVAEIISRVIVKPMTPEIVALAVRLPLTFPKDPLDRVIAATALVEGIPLITADQEIQRSGVVETIW